MTVWDALVKLRWDSWVVRLIRGDRELAMSILAKQAARRNRLFVYFDDPTIGSESI